MRCGPVGGPIDHENSLAARGLGDAGVRRHGEIRGGSGDRGDHANAMAAGEVVHLGRAIVAEDEHRDALTAMLRVIGIGAHQGAAVEEFGDVLVSRDACNDDEVEAACGVGEAGHLWLAALQGWSEVGFEIRRVGAAGGRPETRCELVRRERQGSLAPVAEAREYRARRARSCRVLSSRIVRSVYRHEPILAGNGAPARCGGLRTAGAGYRKNHAPWRLEQTCACGEIAVRQRAPLWARAWVLRTLSAWEAESGWSGVRLQPGS